ncbi:hypothetical protein CXF83_03290 [Shewanella sp. Choline-02u-19]|uniref:hypothetical protein n=1 Tax=unclassified Shewanella TaxID=196818 RepID=UPI000C32C47C|nr:MULTISPECIES: hypothetical protein [unclassified Shewanella]PKH57194.1 hypothetical protein CXF84_09465 [Shewanella sp. Bg11-22]PKI29691.1 hypothetical protein CXF83_03290 [Shewanella sp. Choline-02u-19]
MDPTLYASLLGAGGSIVGALAGTALGYRLSNSKAEIDIYIDNKVWAYYMPSNFAMYVPITVINEGSNSGTITDFKILLTSPTKQQWELFWQDFAEDNSHKGEAWGAGRTASPILVHGKSGTQHYLRFASLGTTSEGISDVALQTGEYKLEIQAFDRNLKSFVSKSYLFNVETEAQETLVLSRSDKENLKTWWFPIRNDL